MLVTVLKRYSKSGRAPKTIKLESMPFSRSAMALGIIPLAKKTG